MQKIAQLATLIVLFSPGFTAPVAAQMLLAEFRADEQPIPVMSAHTGVADMHGPMGEVPVFGETLEIGSLWLDYRFGESLSVEQGSGLTLGTTVGQRFQFLPGQSTDIYYGWSLTAPEDPLMSPAGAAQRRFRSGVGHTLDFLDRRAAVRFGYEYERGDLAAFTEDASAHHLGMAGLWRFGSRYEASVGADYGLLFYPQFAGAGELTGEQFRLHALLQRTFGESLSGRLRYHFADEDFDDPAFSLRRHSLGLDLQYRY